MKQPATDVDSLSPPPLSHFLSPPPSVSLFPLLPLSLLLSLSLSLSLSLPSPPPFSNIYIYMTIMENVEEVIFNARKYLLFCDGKAWVKKDGRGLFDVTMGGGLRARVFVCTCHFSDALPNWQFGTLPEWWPRLPPEGNWCRYESRKESNNEDLGLRITIQGHWPPNNHWNKHQDRQFSPPHAQPEHWEVQAIPQTERHTPVCQQVISPPANGAEKATSRNQHYFDRHLECEEVLAEAEHPYNEALGKSGYSEAVMLLSERKGKQGRDQQKRSQSRKRNITWFTPPFSRNVVTEIARRFLGQVDRHFPQESDLQQKHSESLVQLHTKCRQNHQAAQRKCLECRQPRPAGWLGERMQLQEAHWVPAERGMSSKRYCIPSDGGDGRNGEEHWIDSDHFQGTLWQPQSQYDAWGKGLSNGAV